MATNLSHSGGSLAAFGGVLGFFVIFFAADVPKLRNDVMVKIPVIGSYWKREIAPEDNPF
jgi:type II secretory pathway component PulF